MTTMTDALTTAVAEAEARYVARQPGQPRRCTSSGSARCPAATRAP